MTSCLERLREQISEFDGRSTTILGEAEARHKNDADYLESLIALTSDPANEVSSGATWLLKSFLEGGGSLSDVETTSLMRQLDNVTVWDAQLHICQSARYLSLNGSDAAVFALWLEPLLAHRRPFVRAWSVDALCRVAVQSPKYKKDAQDAIAAASEDDAASVRARVRNIRAETGL